MPLGSPAAGGVAGGTAGPPKDTPGAWAAKLTCGAPASRSASSISKYSSYLKPNIDAMIPEGNCLTRWL